MEEKHTDLIFGGLEQSDKDEARVDAVVSCRYCKSTDGYYLKATTRADIQFGWDGEQIHFVTTDVKYGKRKYCMVCNKVN